MRKWSMGIAALAAIAVVAARVFAVPPGKPISGSKHDFKTTGYTDSAGNTYTAYNKCNTCHAAHKAKKNHPLWGRDNPTDTGWVVWSCDTPLTGQALDGTQGAEYLSAADFVASGTGMCMSCHDGQTAIGKAADRITDVFMKTPFRGNWGRNLSDIHPVGHVVPFGTPGWQTDVGAGNAASGSNVETDTNGTVGCISCHSMHSSEATSSKILRAGERCLSCHDR